MHLLHAYISSQMHIMNFIITVYLNFTSMPIFPLNQLIEYADSVSQPIEGVFPRLPLEFSSAPGMVLSLKMVWKIRRFQRQYFGQFFEH